MPAAVTRRYRNDHVDCLFSVLSGAIRLVGKPGQEGGLLLQLVDALFQYISDTNHTDETTIFFDRKVTDVARQHR